MEEFFSEKQKQDITFFNENLDTWLANPLFKMKYAVISDRKLQGIYDTFESALGNAISKFQPYEFVIQQIISDDEMVNFLSPALAMVQ
ncbi:MAG: hypothetical protein FWC45_04850 [Treponema sp.]|nr:hypothetical protein [Treponema sp.]